MKTTPDALKDLFTALGGEASEVADMSQTVDVLNAIAEKYEGEGNANLIPDAIENIAAVADNIGGVTPTGKKEITDTNETDVAAYATAQVVDANLIAENIKKDISILGITGTYEGGGNADLSIANVTVVIGTVPNPQYVALQTCMAFENGELLPAWSAMSMPINGGMFENNHTYSLKVILYKGKGYARVNQVDFNAVEVSGNATVDADTESIFITGDATITINAAQ